MATVPAPPALDPGSADPAEVTAAARPARAAGGAGGMRGAGAAARPTRVRKESTPAPPATDPRGSCPRWSRRRPSCPPTAPRRSRLRNRLRRRETRRRCCRRCPPTRRAASDHPRHRLRRCRCGHGALGPAVGDDEARRPRSAVAARLARFAGRRLPRARPGARRSGPAARLRRRDRRARALRPDADPRPIGPHAEIDTPRWQRARRRRARRRDDRAARVAAPAALLRCDGDLDTPTTTTPQVAQAVFGTWVWPFELLSVLLLVALIGAFAVSRLVLQPDGDRDEPRPAASGRPATASMASATSASAPAPRGRG